MLSAWRNFKNIFSRPLFTIIFRPEMLKFHPYSTLTGDTMVGFVIFCVLSTYSKFPNKYCSLSNNSAANLILFFFEKIQPKEPYFILHTNLFIFDYNIIMYVSLERRHYLTFHPFGIFGHHWSLLFTVYCLKVLTFLFTWKVAGGLKF